MQSSILLIGAEGQSPAAVQALQRELNLFPACTPDLRSGIAAVRREQYELILLDTSRSEAAHLTDTLYQKAGAALVLEFDFRTTSPSRIVQQVRSALRRRAQHQMTARKSALATVKNELRSSLSGLLLHSQMVLRDASPEQQPKLRYLVELTSNLSDCLRV